MCNWIEKGTGLAVLAMILFAAPLSAWAEGGVPDAEVAGPGAGDLDAGDPEVAGPDAGDPEVAGPDASDPDAGDPDVTDGNVIDTIELRISADIQEGKPCSIWDFDIDLLSWGCEVKEVELLNKNETWGNADIPRLVLYLRTFKGLEFAVKKSGIQIEGAECEDGYYDKILNLYVLRLKLPSLRGQVGEIAEASWSSSSTASWSPAMNGAYYELMLYYEDIKQGNLFRVSSPSCELGDYIRSEGVYYYKVRAVKINDESVKSEWKESVRLIVDSASAEANRQNKPLPYSGQGSSANGAQGAGSQTGSNDTEGCWIAEGSLWWYRNADGSYTRNNWQYINDKWYFFDSRGYMVTGWIDWNDKSYYCDPVSGSMLVSMIVPDGLGLRVDSTGALIE